jgi:chorismate mutase
MHEELQDYRQQIDQIDNQIISLLTKRQEIVNSVSKLKVKSLGSSFIMPRREKDMIKSLQHKYPHIRPELIQYLWRGIISHSLYSEKPFKLHISKQCQIEELFAYFPNFITKEIHNDISSIIGNTDDLIILGYDEAILLHQKLLKNNLICFNKFAKDQSLIFGHINQEFLSTNTKLYIEKNNQERSNDISVLFQQDNISLVESPNVNDNKILLGSY